MGDKYIALEKRIYGLVERGACVAFSGGVDSSLILRIACEAGGKINKDIYALTFETKLHPISDISDAKKLATEMGAIHRIIRLNEWEHNDILKNSIDRCYICKKTLFINLLKFAKNNSVTYILDGTNGDDLKQYRPGIQALKDLGIISPLAELNINKEEIREMAKKLNISVASRPSAPCMATRIPYGTEISFELLERIDKGERFIKKLGLETLRMRVHNDMVRLEVDKIDFPILLKNKDKIIKYLKDLGFVYITLDLEGFRSGSMDVYINNQL